MTTHREYTLLSAVAATGAGTAREVDDHTEAVDIFITASSVTSGATVNVQVQGPDDNWYDLLDSTQATITADGQHGPFHAPVGYPNYRGNISARTDGTYTVSILARKN